jgi:hypothetical protein
LLGRVAVGFSVGCKFESADVRVLDSIPALRTYSEYMHCPCTYKPITYTYTYTLLWGVYYKHYNILGKAQPIQYLSCLPLTGAPMTEDHASGFDSYAIQIQRRLTIPL